MARNPRLPLEDMLRAITHIEEDLAGIDCNEFLGDRRRIQLIERNLEIISGASRCLPESLKAQETDIDWRAVAGIGNILRHDYHKSNPRTLWDTCSDALPPLKDALKRIEENLEALEE